MSNRLDLDVAFVLAQIDALQVAYPEILDDEQLRADMTEGSTALHELLDVVVDRMQDAEAKADGIDGLITAWKARQHRFSRRVEAMRSFAYKLMDKAGVRKVELPAATLSIRAGQQHVIITAKNPEDLPPDCVRTRKEADKVAIKERLMRGETIAGAELSNREDVLSVRIK